MPQVVAATARRYFSGRQAFESDWRNALRIANALDSPGIMFDCEWYTNGNISSIEKLARMRGKDEATTIAKCEMLGARLADIIEEAYPEAVIIWFFTDKITHPRYMWSTLDFEKPEVLDYLFRITEEVCQRYDVDGIGKGRGR